MKSNIRELRNERQISQTTLANVIGKTQQTVSHMEHDRDRIPIESLIAMADYFGVSTDCVLGIESEQKETTEEEKENSVPSDTASDKKTLDKKTIKQEAEDIKTGFAKDDKKVLYQLILSLLLCSLEDDMSQV